MKQIIAGIFLFLSVPLVLAGHHEENLSRFINFFTFTPWIEQR